MLSTSQMRKHPVHLVRRAVTPWTLLPQTGTIAADTTHFPLRTRMLVPGYGWAEVRTGVFLGVHSQHGVLRGSLFASVAPLAV